MTLNILQMRDIDKGFNGVPVLKHVNLEVRRGEVHAICGENGAGKSTLMKVLSGVYPHGQYEGEIIWEGKEVSFSSIKDSEALGIGIIHQELALVPYLSVAENLFLGIDKPKRHGLIDWHEINHRAEEVLAKVGLDENVTTPVGQLGVGKQQLIEIGKALSKDVKLLILDEPTAALNDNDSAQLLELVRQLKESGVSIVIISHKLNEIAYVADKITIIRDGSTIETLDKNAGEISEPRIIKGMVGRDLTNRFPPRQPNVGEVSMEVRNWTVYHPLYTERKVVDDVSITLRKGEVVGISGLIGAGRTELCKSVFGRAYGTKISGQLLIDGKEVYLNSVSEAIQAGLAYITEDRKGDGLVLSDSIKHNTTLARLDFVSERGVVDVDKEYQSADEYKKKLGVKAPSVEQVVGNLSGGNQQKVLIGKWMFAQPDIMMLDEPTRGIDVNAKYEIYCIINDLVAQGKSVLMVSSELPEILGMCDRTYVMCEGRIVGEFTREEATQEKIMDRIMQASKGEIGK